MEELTKIPCYLTRKDLNDALGQRLIKLQKRRDRDRRGAEVAWGLPDAEVKRSRNRQQRPSQKRPVRSGQVTTNTQRENSLLQCSQADQILAWWDEGDLQEFARDEELYGQESEEQDEFIISAEELELAAQMSALGLPTVLGGGIKHEARSSDKKKRRKSRKAVKSSLFEAEAEPVSQSLLEDAARLEASPLASQVAITADAAERSSNSDSPWQPVWDSEYGSFYGYNTASQESQWDAPVGLDVYAAALYAFEREEDPDIQEGGRGDGLQVTPVECSAAQAVGGGQGDASGVAGLGAALRSSDQGEDERVEGRVKEEGSGRDGAIGPVDVDRRAAFGTASEGGGAGGPNADGGLVSEQSAGIPLDSRSNGCKEGQTSRLPDGKAKSSKEAEGAKMGPQSPGTGLRGFPRPCGQHIRFEDGCDAQASGGKDKASVGRTGEMGPELPSSLVKEEHEEGFDPMEEDDPMDIDTYGGVARWSRNWHGVSRGPVSGEVPLATALTSRGWVKDVEKEKAEAAEGRAFLSNEVVTGAGSEEISGASLSGYQAVLLGNCLLEAAQERSHGLVERMAEIAGGLQEDAVVQGSPGGGEKGFAQARLLRGGETLGSIVPGFDGKSTSNRVRPDVSSAPNGSARVSIGPYDPSDQRAESPASSALETESEGEDALALSASPSVQQDTLLPVAPRTGRCTQVLETVTPALESGNKAGAQEELAEASVEEPPDEPAKERLKAEGPSLMTSAVTPAAAAGAGGDAGGAVLAASARGREKPADVGQKYWFQRYRLFSKFDQGVRLDPEGWYSVTPEAIAIHHAKRCAGRVVIDAFAGVGGNAIQMATSADWVVAVDMDPGRLALAEHNARVYGVRDKIEFVIGDFLKLAPSLRADVLFLSPPWGGPEYNLVETYDLDTMLEPVSGVELFKAALQVTSSIALFLPRNVNIQQLQELAWLASPPLPCEIESNYLCGKLKCITAYYGDLVIPPSDLDT